MAVTRHCAPRHPALSEKDGQPASPRMARDGAGGVTAFVASRPSPAMGLNASTCVAEVQAELAAFLGEVTFT